MECRESLSASPRVSVDGDVSGDVNNEDRTNVPTVTFATALKSTKPKMTVPDRDQAVIFDSIDDTNKDDYIIATGNIVGPKNILFASRVSNNRICIYFSSKEVVESFITEKEGILVNNTFIKARRLVSPAKRIILSNVSPSLPNEVIMEELKRLKLNVVSPITFIGAGLSNPEYKHVLSFRRQIYIILDDNETLPESILILYKQNYFRIFISTDEVRCFSCKKLGHVAQKCTMSRLQTSQVEISNAEKPAQTESIESVKSNVNKTSIPEKVISSGISEQENVISHKSPSLISESVYQPIVSKKRLASSNTESDSTINEECSTSLDIHSELSKEEEYRLPKFKKPDPKRRKNVEVVADDTSSYEEFKSIFNEEIEVINFKDFCQFLNDVKGKQEVMEIANVYTRDIPSLLEVIIRSIRLVKTGALKGRLKRVAKKIKSAGILISEDTLSLSSSQEGYSSDISER